MAIANTSGADYTIQPNLKGSGSVNNRGTAARAGSVSPVLKNVAVSRAQVGAFASTVVDGTETDKAVSSGSIAYNNTKPTAMRYSTTVAGQSNMVLRSGADVPGQIRSIAKRESYKVTKISTAIRTAQWNSYTGKYKENGTYSRTGYSVTVTIVAHGLVSGDVVKLDFTSGNATDGVYSVVRVDDNTFTLTDTATGSTSGNVVLYGPAGNTESPGTDNAANPSRTAPGQLTYKGGARLPVTNNDYKAKTG